MSFSGIGVMERASWLRLPGSAMREFNEWIAAFPGLMEALYATGLARKSKRYTPAQVRLIAGALGEP